MGNILEEFWYGNINPQEQSKESSRAVKELIKLVLAQLSVSFW